MSLRHVYAVTLKEIRHILRDKATFILVVFTPTFLLLLLAYAVTADISHVPISVLDMDHSPTSRAFIEQIALGDDLELISQVNSINAIEDQLLKGVIKAAVILSPSFERDLYTMRGAGMQILVDGTEPQSGGFAVEKIAYRAEEFISKLLVRQLATQGIAIDRLLPIDVRTQTWYNPNLKASVDIIPGLLSIVLALPGMSVALTLAREREHGTLEQLMASPIGKAELLIGKMIPYILSGLINIPLTTAIALYWFDVPFNGNFGLFILLSGVFFFAILSMGVLIGVFIHSQAAALALSLLLVLFPGFFLTGIFFPIAAMPPIVRMEAMALPGTHYAIITRASFVTGAGIDVLWMYGLALLLMGICFTGIAAYSFKKQLA
jgi:ABC-2 type transport system permease protein